MVGMNNTSLLPYCACATLEHLVNETNLFFTVFLKLKFQTSVMRLSVSKQSDLKKMFK